MSPSTTQPILVTGATGYIGGRLVPLLLAQGYRVRCLARDPNRLRGRGWDDRVEIVQGDMLDRNSLKPALEGCRAAFYLVHSMLAGEGEFREQDLQAAKNFREVADEARLERILYLGGLGKRSEKLSNHLASRHEVGDVLREGPVPVTELRAAMIMGSGSASFEMLRALVKRLPLMVCPKWVNNRTQPIAIRSVLAYLIGCLENPKTAGQVFDIGGPDILTYKEMMIRYAAVLGMKRWIVVAPVLTPRLSAYWASMISPVPSSITFPLIEGLGSETICENDKIKEFVNVSPVSFEEAVTIAHEKIRLNEVETRWTNASLPWGKSKPKAFAQTDFSIRDEQIVESKAAAKGVFDAVSRIGGTVGWYYAEPLWELRGLMDRLIGGVGLRRGRRDPNRIFTGDAIDFWRVSDYVPGSRLLLHAEMKVPGEAWLEFAVRSIGENGEQSELKQTAYFKPSSIWGSLYWYLCFPFHFFIFRGMAHAIVAAAEKKEAEEAKGVTVGTVA